jgi:uncharacterized membrane protein
VHGQRGRRLSATAIVPRPLWRTRIIVYGCGLAAALLVTAFAPAWLHGTVRAVAAYDIGTLIVLLLHWLITIDDDPRATGARGALEDPGRWAVLAIVLMSIFFGFASSVVILGKGPNVPAPDRDLALAFGIAAIVLGWLLIHTMFIFRYAHLYYYDDDDDGSAARGLIFPGTADPDDYDFAYFSFVIGMTFQVSDVQITDPAVRRVVLVHAMLSFAYNTAIIALVVNLASGLFSSH